MNRFWKKKYGSQRLRTEMEIGDTEHPVWVDYQTGPPDPEVDWLGDLDITDVILIETGKSVFMDMTEDMFEQLWLSVERHENESHEDPRY